MEARPKMNNEIQPDSTQLTDNSESKREKAETDSTFQKLANWAFTPIVQITSPQLAEKDKSQDKIKENEKEKEVERKEFIENGEKPQKMVLVEIPSDEVGRCETNIDNVPFYHGFMGRSECESMLRNHGDFLVRLTEIGRREQYVISIKWENQPHHVIIKRTKRKRLYWIKRYAFQTICELIVYHKRYHIPIFNNMLLNCGIGRHHWQLNHEQVMLTTKLGEGQFGEVHKGLLKVSVFRLPFDVAVKTLHHNHLTADEKIMFLREASVMQSLCHPNVIRFYGVCTMKEPMMIVMELCCGKSLEDALTAVNSKFTPDELVQFVSHAACGINYLHQKHVLHRDIAARNCLLGVNNVLKISDFGLSVKGVAIKERKGGKLPVKYMAPETLKKGLYSKASDIYSFGALIYEVFHKGKVPFVDCGLEGNELRKAIINKKIELKLTSTCPEFIVEMFGKCRAYESTDRITANDLMIIFKTEREKYMTDREKMAERMLEYSKKLKFWKRRDEKLGGPVRSATSQELKAAN